MAESTPADASALNTTFRGCVAELKGGVGVDKAAEVPGVVSVEVRPVVVLDDGSTSEPLVDAPNEPDDCCPCVALEEGNTSELLDVLLDVLATAVWLALEGGRTSALLVLLRESVIGKTADIRFSSQS